MDFATLLNAPDASIASISEYLDGLDHGGRMKAMGRTSKADQRKLWHLAEASPPLSFEDFVPASVPDATEVIHHGRNTLPAFRSFQKRFARPADHSARLFGYNEGATRALIGPGYFVMRATEGNAAWEARGSLVVDYFMVPELNATLPPGWPPLRFNHQGPQRLVYYHTRDFMRRVSAHVTVGMAFKEEASLNNWFTLVREDD